MIRKLLFIILLFIPTYLLAGEPGNEPVSNEIDNTNDQEITNNKMPVTNENQNNDQNLNVETSSNVVKQPTEIEAASKETTSIEETNNNEMIEVASGNNFECYKSSAGENPFLRDLSDELLKRQDNGACVYPLDTFRVVGILDSNNQGQTIQNNSTKLALVQIPNNQDQIIISEGQILGSKGGIVKEIDFDSIVVEEEGNLVRLEVIQ
jgi:Tfp pilus assembly protein PilP